MQLKLFITTAKGFSLMELIIASALSLLLITSMMDTYLLVKKAFLLEQALLTIQENGLFLTYFFNRNIHIGVDKAEENKNCIMGYQNNLPEFLNNSKAIANSGVIVIKHCAADENKIMEKMGFFIADTGRKNGAGEPVLGLFEQAEGGRRLEVVADVEKMRILYGISANDSNNIQHYFTSTQMTSPDWQWVRSVEIKLLLKSTEPALLQPESYVFDDIHLAKSRFLYKTWNLYIALREQ